MSLRIEVATENDIPALAELLSLLFSQESEFTPNVEAQKRGLSKIITNPAIGTVLVAKRCESTIGMVNLLYTVSTALGEPVALLEDLIVRPEARCAGVGSKLLHEAICLAKANGCKRITLLTEQTNLAAQRFYKRHGFESSLMMPLRLAIG